MILATGDQNVDEYKLKYKNEERGTWNSLTLRQKQEDVAIMSMHFNYLSRTDNKVNMDDTGFDPKYENGKLQFEKGSQGSIDWSADKGAYNSDRYKNTKYTIEYWIRRFPQSVKY